MKVSFFNKQVAKSFYGFVSAIATVISLVLIFFPMPEDITITVKVWHAMGLLTIFIALYLIIWLCANAQKEAKLKINGIEVSVKTGDLFAENGNFKVIPFNEHFDTKVDDVIISKSSLNGIYINRYFNGAEKELAKRIASDPRLKKVVKVVETPERGRSRMTYPLGTIHKEGDVLLLAFSKFNQNNEAYLDDKTLWECLINMWREIGTTYAGKSIDLPLVGSGITRLQNININGQELLELILLSLKVSGLCLNWNVSINVIIHPNNAKHINFYKLQDYLD
jgi:hypothetical protein